MDNTKQHVVLTEQLSSFPSTYPNSIIYQLRETPLSLSAKPPHIILLLVINAGVVLKKHQKTLYQTAWLTFLIAEHFTRVDIQ